MAVGQGSLSGEVRKAGFQIASLGIQPVTSIAKQTKQIVSRRAGCIHVASGNLIAVTGRWWPYAGNHLQATFDYRLRPLKEDLCQLYFHEPFGSPGFLTLSYVRSGDKTSLSSFYGATLVLDAIAELKGSNAIVCNVTNDRITDRLLARWGWEMHCDDWPGRHFIKRFYGNYPEIKPVWHNRLTLS